MKLSNAGDAQVGAARTVTRFQFWPKLLPAYGHGRVREWRAFQTVSVQQVAVEARDPDPDGGLYVAWEDRQWL